MTEDSDEEKKSKNTLSLSGGNLSLKGGAGEQAPDTVSKVTVEVRHKKDAVTSNDPSHSTKKKLDLNTHAQNISDQSYKDRNQKIYWNLSKAVNKNSRPKEHVETDINFVLSCGKIDSSALRNKFLELREKNNARPPTPQSPWLTNICRNLKGDILHKIERADIQKALQTGECLYVQNIKAVKIFYCFYGRNAWHSTWVQKYTKDCMHLTLESAKDFVERQRVQGSVFYITELPALQIESGDYPIFITQINENDPLSKYSSQALHENPPAGAQKIDQARDNYFMIGASLVGLIYSFDGNSRFWNIPPVNNNKAMILCANASNQKALEIENNSMRMWQSESHGSNYRFGWVERNTQNNHSASSVVRLSNQFKAFEDKHTISKSQYIKGLQCGKALWLYRHRKDLAPEITPEKQALFDTGHEIGELAMRYFGDGVEVTNEYWDVMGAVEATEQYIKAGHDIIFEATAVHPVNGCYSRIDILKRVEGSDEWDLIEVKSSTQVKDYHIDDMSFQYHVFYGAGYRIRKCFMMVINNEYVRNGEIDPQQLLRLEEISGHVFAKQGEVDAVAGQLGYILERKVEPEMSIGARCFKPFECDYKPYCWVHAPKYSVYDVFQKPRAEEIAKRYGLDIEGLPDHIRPGGAKGLDVESYLNGETIVDRANISAFLRKIQYPLYFLDYETVMPAIPIFDGTRPFQQIPFQFSVHVQHSPDAELKHYEYLHKERTDPRRSFAEKLIELCGSEGTVLVYNQAFEIARNNELARDFPEYAAAIEAINARILDLLVPFKSRWLYHPNQNSSASIKAVLPAFTDLSYDDLEISHGGEAMRQYGAFMSGDLNESLWPDLWNDLTEYCKQDTYAMVLLLDVLNKIED